MHATTVAVDLAKSFFQIAVADENWRVVETQRLTRSQFERWFINRSVGLVVMEACGSAHHWARWLGSLGIEVRLLPAQYVRAYVRRNKTDATDAAALLEAARASDLRPVRVKSVEQQALQGLHRIRSLWMGARTSRINALRGFCREFGIAIPVGARTGIEAIGRVLADPQSAVPELIRHTASQLLEETKRKCVVTTDSRHSLPVAPDLVQRRFNPEAPNQLWSGDITYIQTDEGWLYLAAVIDLFNRQVVGWSLQPHMQAGLVKDALAMAWWRRRPPPRVIFHSDRGSQYCSHEVQRALKDWGIRSSMSRKGNCWDNAPTESFWGRLKTASVHGHKFATREQARQAVMDWMAFYNHRRLHSSLDYLSPMQYEQRWYEAQRKKAA